MRLRTPAATAATPASELFTPVAELEGELVCAAAAPVCEPLPDEPPEAVLLAPAAASVGVADASG